MYVADIIYTDSTFTIVQTSNPNIVDQWEALDSRHIKLVDNNITWYATKISDKRVTFNYKGTWDLLKADSETPIERYTINNNDYGTGYFFNDPSTTYAYRASRDDYTGLLSISHYPLLSGYDDAFCYALAVEQYNNGEDWLYLTNGYYCIYEAYDGKTYMRFFFDDYIRTSVKV